MDQDPTDIHSPSPQPRRDSAPCEARPVGVQAEGWVAEGGEMAAMSESYWMSWDPSERKWVLWAHRKLIQPVERVASLPGNCDQEPDPAKLLAEIWHARKENATITLEAFVPAGHSPHDLGLEDRLHELTREVAETLPLTEKPPLTS